MVRTKQISMTARSFTVLDSVVGTDNLTGVKPVIYDGRGLFNFASAK